MAVNEKIRFKIKGYDHATVDIAAAKIVEAAKRSGARVSGPIPLPTDKEVVTILRAVHKYKDSREQFEQRTHKRLAGALAAGTYPSRVFKGNHAPGRMGRDTVTVQNVVLVKTLADRNIMMVKGAVPGKKGGLLKIRPAVKGQDK